MYILTFDEDTAFVDGLPVRAMSIAFNVVTGVAIALMIPAAGALLVSTIMVLPLLLHCDLVRVLKLLSLLGWALAFGMVMGLLTSYYAETPASASITLIFISIFLLVNVVQNLKIRS